MSGLWSRICALILFVVALPANALALLLSIPSWTLGGFGLRVYRGALWLSCPYLLVGARTLGPNVVQIKHIDLVKDGPRIVIHELSHSEQAQGASLLGAATSIVLWFEGRPLWGVMMPITLAWLATAGASYVVAFLRGEHIYRGAAIEEAARAAEE